MGPPAEPGSHPSLVRVTHLVKSFGATRALRDASFDLHAGEVHALVGENGSGKSTLVKILSGVHTPDTGTIEISGTEIPLLRVPRQAQKLGIATVFQEILVAEARSVLDNVFLGSEGAFRSPLTVREKRSRAEEVLLELLGRPLNLSTAVEDLSLSDRQACCIARALLREPRILILDEATSALDIATRDRLFGLVARLVGRGVGLVFITHRLDEISQIGDRLTVMRSGETVATRERGQWTAGELVELMTGQESSTNHAIRRPPAKRPQEGPVVLSATEVQMKPNAAAFNVAIHAGEIVGVAGLEGQGQERFLDALRGAGVVSGQVARHVDGRSVQIDSIQHAAALGVAYAPRERGQTAFRWMSVRENFGMPTLTDDRVGGWLRPSATRRRLAKYVELMSIVLSSPEAKITTLSGGNQQKVMIARWLAASPQVLLLNDPTRGIDIGAKRDLYLLLDRLVREGLSVVMLSTELEELIDLMDRVLVFREDELFMEIPRSALTRQALVSAFFGQSEDGNAAR